MSSVRTVDSRPDEHDDQAPQLVSRHGDTLVMSAITVDGSVRTDEPQRAPAGPVTDDPGTAVLNMSDFWPAIEAAEADEQARREPRVGHVLVLIPAHNEGCLHRAHAPVPAGADHPARRDRRDLR